MIFEIDYGNTRLKWRLLKINTSEVIARGVVNQLQELVPSLQSAGRISLDFCRVCSVRSNDDNAALTSLISETYGVAVEYARSTKSLGGVTNGYLEAGKLGVDRWLAVVAAYVSTQAPCVVIDSGTAITVDYINAGGVHLGGCIAPGFSQMASMLKNSTQLRVDLDSAVNVGHACLARDTQAALYSGIRAMVSGFIKEQLLCAQAELGASFAVVCAGGDSGFICDVAADAVVDEDLVFTGLAIACPYVVQR